MPGRSDAFSGKWKSRALPGWHWAERTETRGDTHEKAVRLTRFPEDCWKSETEVGTRADNQVKYHVLVYVCLSLTSAARGSEREGNLPCKVMGHGQQEDTPAYTQ